MGLISTLKSVIGIDDSKGGRGGTSVTVEREPDASSERSVKSDAPETAHPDTEAEEDEIESAVDQQGGVSEAGVGSVDETDASLEEIKGIGPAYADRLAAAGVGSVQELAQADASALDEETGIGEGRIETWIERAAAR